MTNKKLLTCEITPKTAIEQALTQPGTISGCYSLFRDFSANNTISFAMQLKEKGLPISPVMAGKAWVKNGYITEEQRLKNKSNLLYGLLPVFKTYYVKDANGEVVKDENGNPKTRQYLSNFKTVQAWLASSQLNVKVKQNIAIEFSENDLLTRLGLTLVDWNLIEGNAQGYAIPNEKVVAINPLCTKRIDTLLHEVAHCLLHSNENKIVDGELLNHSQREVEAELTSYVCLVMLGVDNEEMLSNARGYIQHYMNDLKANEKEFKSYGRVYKAVNTIMKAIANHKGNFKVSKSDFQESATETDYKGE